MTRKKSLPVPQSFIDKLLAHLTAEADLGHVCLTNEQLGRVLGMAETNGVSPLLRRLVREGRIELVTDGGNRRQITITATGKVLKVRGMHITLEAKVRPRKDAAPRKPVEQVRMLSGDEIAARVARDQAAMRTDQIAARARELPGLNRLPTPAARIERAFA